MYDIVQEEISSVNGLGAGGENLKNFMPLINAAVNAGTQIAQTAITTKQQAKAQAQNQYVGGNTYTPTVYTSTPPTTPTTNTTEGKKDWTPWIIGGAILAGGLLLFALKK